MGERYIFTIRQLTKTYNKKEVLKDIWLAFYPGAKIGVLGPNGSGKSTLLRIMALQDRDFLGEAEPDQGISVGYVPTEPKLTPGKTGLGTVVAVTHGRYFLDNVAKWILELDRGRGYPYEGNYTGWLEKKKARLEIEEKAESARRKQLERELEWSRMAPRARIAKSKARLAAIDKLQEQQYEEREDELVLQIPPGPPLGDLVVRAVDLKKAYGDNLLFEGMNFDLPRGGIVGIIG